MKVIIRTPDRLGVIRYMPAMPRKGDLVSWHHHGVNRIGRVAEVMHYGSMGTDEAPPPEIHIEGEGEGG